MKAVLIDPHAMTVTDIELPDEPPLSEFCRVIDCDLVEILELGGGLALVIDEEGMLRDQVSDPSGEDTMPQAFFRVMDTALAGRAVLVRLNDDADSGFESPGMCADDIRALMGYASSVMASSVMAWIDQGERDRLMRAQRDAFIAAATAAGAEVDDCGDMVVVASWGNK